ncbi:hypothetical protein OA2633_10554 [Oceanicaulis sp. HTCC2633]|uniref:hypothetical protein n=1 Tax=Oceanicaulis sp. HTCC2633 TaxID=314254 RepID=UPI0000669757|nr:hypothetical protein [Oceanicaulis sp. HTCC2633]EAP89701.1 hypothetical protein OA2633_10554 [Oceanicaulis sp. HTCC2633]
MFDLSLFILGGVFVLFILACLVRWWVSVRGLTEEAHAEYQTRKAEKPGTIKGVSEAEFIRLYVSCFQPRWTLYAAASAGAAILISPVALLAVPALYDVIWRMNGAPEWGGRTGYVFMFALFFGVVFIWAAFAAVIARLHHLRAPEPFNHALARARGEPIEDTGWRPRPKWARKIKIDSAQADTDS